jgi:hypothetical protein
MRRMLYSIDPGIDRIVLTSFGASCMFIDQPGCIETVTREYRTSFSSASRVYSTRGSGKLGCQM